METEVQDQQREETLLRNVLTVRWNDSQHRIITDLAWRERRSASDLIRSITIESLKQRGVDIG